MCVVLLGEAIRWRGRPKGTGYGAVGQWYGAVVRYKGTMVQYKGAAVRYKGTVVRCTFAPHQKKTQQKHNQFLRVQSKIERFVENWLCFCCVFVVFFGAVQRYTCTVPLYAQKLVVFLLCVFGTSYLWITLPLD